MGTLAAGSERYDVMATVGKGTFGEVTQGWRRSTGEMVAIKILKNDGHGGRAAENELKLLKALREAHAEEAHVVRFLESFGDGARTYLVFELLEQSLFDFQKRNNFAPLPVRHIRTIAAQLLAALAKLGELAIIHADLKPQNIMLVDHARHPFRVKLIDFGSAGIFPEVRHVEEPYIQSRFYRAPEILLGLPFCEKVDVWSLGCVVAELHLGWPLYPGSNEYEQIRYICSTLGLPRGELLRAARKTRSFFQPCPAGSWRLKAPVAKLRERRKYVLSSLDQLAAVNARPVSSRESLAERHDLCAMVELLKKMLTWGAWERTAPRAALQHPFISLRHIGDAFEATRYYQLCQEGLRVSRTELGATETFPSAFIPAGTQEATTRMDALSLVGDVGDETRRDIRHISVPTRRRQRQDRTRLWELNGAAPLSHRRSPGKPASSPELSTDVPFLRLRSRQLAKPGSVPAENTARGAPGHATPVLSAPLLAATSQ